MVVGKRAILICWVIRACKKGHLPTKMHLELFTLLHKLLENYANVVILGDGEFDNQKIIEACKQWNWHFALRTAINTRIFDGRDDYAIGELAPAQGQYFVHVSDVAYTKQRYGPVNATCWHEPKWDNPIYLLSSFELAYDMAYYYRKRCTMETLFSDVKSRGFNVHKSKLSDLQRVAKLLIIARLAYILVFRLGQNEQNSIFVPKVTRKGRMDLSIFPLGKKLIQYCLKHSITIIFSFSKNCFINNT